MKKLFMYFLFLSLSASVSKFTSKKVMNFNVTVAKFLPHEVKSPVSLLRVKKLDPPPGTVW